MMQAKAGCQKLTPSEETLRQLKLEALHFRQSLAQDGAEASAGDPNVAGASGGDTRDADTGDVVSAGDAISATNSTSSLGPREIRYPSTLNSYQRRSLHEYAEELGLSSGSSGEGTGRS